jgi:hypothetical protein
MEKVRHNFVTENSSTVSGLKDKVTRDKDGYLVSRMPNA